MKLWVDGFQHIRNEEFRRRLAMKESGMEGIEKKTAIVIWLLGKKAAS